jgi:glucokinase
VQAVASGPALAAQAHRLGLAAPDGRTVALLADGGDVAAGQLLRHAADALGQGLAMATLVIDPSIVVLGGGVAQSLDLDVVAETIARRSMRPVPLTRTTLADNAPLIGCAVAHLEATA